MSPETLISPKLLAVAYREGRVVSLGARAESHVCWEMGRERIKRENPRAWSRRHGGRGFLDGEIARGDYSKKVKSLVERRKFWRCREERSFWRRAVCRI